MNDSEKNAGSSGMNSLGETPTTIFKPSEAGCSYTGEISSFRALALEGEMGSGGEWEIGECLSRSKSNDSLAEGEKGSSTSVPSDFSSSASLSCDDSINW